VFTWHGVDLCQVGSFRQHLNIVWMEGQLNALRVFYSKPSIIGRWPPSEEVLFDDCFRAAPRLFLAFFAFILRFFSLASTQVYSEGMWNGSTSSLKFLLSPLSLDCAPRPPLIHEYHEADPSESLDSASWNCVWLVGGVANSSKGCSSLNYTEKSCCLLQTVKSKKN
jgi:hypothetical protein